MSSPRVWLITGTSSGFGLSMAKRALEAGDKVVATLRVPSDIADIASAHPSSELAVIKVDVTRPEDVTNAFSEAKARFGRVDVVFNNAATSAIGEIESVPDADARRIFDVNFWGAAVVSREAVRFFREENPPGTGGLLLNMSSDTGHASVPCIGYYSAAKHALEGFTEALAYEIDPKWNIKICIVVPGAFRTPIRAKSPTMPAHPAYLAAQPVNQARKYLNSLWDPSRPVQIGDVDKAVQKIYELSKLENTPMRLFLGKNCLERIRAKIQRLTGDVDGYEQWSEDLLEAE